MQPSNSKERPNCFMCVSFFITHEARLPYACRAFGMKSRALPAMEVFRTSGEHCQLFQHKPKPARPGPESN